jgi:hypothetical protein
MKRALGDRSARSKRSENFADCAQPNSTGRYAYRWVERAVRNRTDSSTQWKLAIDDGFVRGNRKSECSSFEVLTGRLAAKDRTPHVFAFVRNELLEAVERLTMLVRSVTACKHLKLPLITDGANSLRTISSRLLLPVELVLDGCHISTRVKYLEQPVVGTRAATEPRRFYLRETLYENIQPSRRCISCGNPASGYRQPLHAGFEREECAVKSPMSVHAY